MRGWSQFDGLCQNQPWPVHPGWLVLAGWKFIEAWQILSALNEVSNFCNSFNLWNNWLLIKISILGKTGGSTQYVVLSSVCKNKNVIQCLLIYNIVLLCTYQKLPFFSIKYWSTGERKYSQTLLLGARIASTVQEGRLVHSQAIPVQQERRFPHKHMDILGPLPTSWKGSPISSPWWTGPPDGWRQSPSSPCFGMPKLVNDGNQWSENSFFKNHISEAKHTRSYQN